MAGQQGDHHGEGDQGAGDADDANCLWLGVSGKYDNTDKSWESCAQAHPIIRTSNIIWGKPSYIPQEAGLEDSIDTAVDGVGDQHHDEQVILPGVGVQAGNG